jgi:hypothetical protein
MKPNIAPCWGVVLLVSLFHLDGQPVLAEAPSPPPPGVVFGNDSSLVADSVWSHRGSGSVFIDVATLKEQLESGLMARRPEEFTFIGRVVQLVDTGVLPLDVVKSTFQWARDKRPHPYPYFERAIRIRAGALGVSID